MNIFEWLEQTGLALWVAESLFGYPFVLTCHAVGLAIVVGILFMWNLRILGCFKGVSFAALGPLIKLAWAGFVLNFLSGIALFSAQASYFITNRQFLIKIGAIFLAAIVTAFMQNMQRQHATSWDASGVVSSSAKYLAIASLLLWSIAIVAGRLIAYL